MAYYLDLKVYCKVEELPLLRSGTANDCNEGEERKTGRSSVKPFTLKFLCMSLALGLLAEGTLIQFIVL